MASKISPWVVRVFLLCRVSSWSVLPYLELMLREVEFGKITDLAKMRQFNLSRRKIFYAVIDSEVISCDDGKLHFIN